MTGSARGGGDAAGPAPTEPDAATPVLPERVRRRLDDVFGDVLPEITRDETDDGPSTGDDDWLRANRPPHHDQG